MYLALETSYSTGSLHVMCVLCVLRGNVHVHVLLASAVIVYMYVFEYIAVPWHWEHAYVCT